MTLKWDYDYVESWRSRSVQSADTFVPGEHYWATGHDGRFIFVRLVSDQEMNWGGKSPDVYSWFEAVNSKGERFFGSLNDHCIGARYNPWLVFDTENAALEYESGLKTWQEDDPADDPSLDHSDSYDYPYEDDAYDSYDYR